ncbi:division-specific transpeptidase,penicillin-binding protein 3 [Candidatus Competibacter denitrificans Run_A_D11]|uniref:Peptidoglycan D,D-transpeptidase FtsI n=1 Tax=Candidatus Competibacter denitrificans Run_A_D11 TaxID=1400863 RepID=W6M1R3_9GAMM|nr:penicillin-binding transpeptidase domain-containing protein [Candidatus Competibacter denitrificans]CDI01367.1 division-specific transpeptidase,penicillin-binding protein 3 [Candidatus Competibacter denitrificans Run_A_D11]HAS87157.1 cell division protein [Candidatus Competibacteraceae bacterium]HRC69205.1 penicillin-binding transpeptidase domain-containing protein [Candidatus Competibacter denitrificans]
MNKSFTRKPRWRALARQALKTFPVVSRRVLVLWLVFAMAGSMVARATYLQLVHNDFLQEQGNERFLRVVEVPAHRGMILDRNGEPLAVSSPVDSIWAEPSELLRQRERWPSLAAALKLPLSELEEKLAGRDDSKFAYLRRHLAPNLAQQVLKLKIPGVHAKREYRRYYPDAEVTSHLLGFTDIDDAGQEGLEKAFDPQLKGIPGRKRVIQDRMARIVEDVENVQAPQPGKPVVLSIDRRLQYLAYRALKTAVAENKASAGAAVIVDARTGEVLAMVSQPAGNPNNRAELHSELLRNRAITDVYEPGSTVKPFTAALGLESGKWSPGTRVSTSPMMIGRYSVRDTHNYGVLDVTRIISKSSNVGVSKIALSMPAQKLWQLYQDLGFGSQTKAAAWDGEQSGVLRHFSKWGEIGHATHSFGYGFSVTILQLAEAYTVLAADGMRRPLTLRKREGPLGPDEQERVLNASAVRQVRAMMEQVISERGTGLKADVPGYRVAGKTGTARKISGGRYISNRHVALFAGLVPASDPRLVMTVLIDDPKGGAYYGGTVAAPVFSKTMGAVLRIMNITPDDMPSMKIAGTVQPVGALP